MTHNIPIEERTIKDYLAAIASTEPMPGGGSVAGVVAALGASLGQMVVCLTQDPQPSIVEAVERLENLKASALVSSSADETAYNGFLTASGMPKSTAEEKSHRRDLIQAALQECAAVPMELAENAAHMIEAMDPIVKHGNKNILADAAAGITLALACIDISLRNVRENARYIKDESVSGSLRSKAQKIQEQANARAGELQNAIRER